VKRETAALAILFMWGSLGCATRPPKPYFAHGPGPHDFDCDAPPGYYRELNVHATKGKLRLAGFIQVESVHTPQAPHWYPQAAIVFKGLTEAPFVGFRAFVNPRLPDQFPFALRPGLTPSDDSQVFMAMGVGEPPIAFELTCCDGKLCHAARCVASVPMTSSQDNVFPGEHEHGNGDLRGPHQPFEGKWTGDDHPSERFSNTG